MSNNELDKRFVKAITSKEEDYSQWYVDVILKTELADYSPVKGCMVIRPYGFSVWENIQRLLDKRFKDTGHTNAYFPIFIPESLLQKEADHVEGFAPEVAWVTHGGKELLAERLVVRPTSETIICSMYAKWIKSWRDLPILINQWANVVRWEKSTKPFLRTTEFLWQEGHTAHRTEEDAEEETLKMLDVYRDFVEEDLAIPVIQGRKSEREKFAGALRTYSIEALMSDGKGLQAGTSHNLGQHFAKVFDISFTDKDDQIKYVWQTSWGVSTRLIGAVIMVHGDERGLRMPPNIAPFQGVIVPIMPQKMKDIVLDKAYEIFNDLKSDFRMKIDNREEYSPGWKFNEWEMKGVPLRIEIGPKDIENNQAVLVRRDTNGKITVKLEQLKSAVGETLKEIQKNLYNQAKAFLEENTHSAKSYDEFKDIISNKRGMVKAMWCNCSECEGKVKAETMATIRNIPFVQEKLNDKCIHCGKPAEKMVYFARAY